MKTDQCDLERLEYALCIRCIRATEHAGCWQIRGDDVVIDNGGVLYFRPLLRFDATNLSVDGAANKIVEWLRSLATALEARP